MVRFKNRYLLVELVPFHCDADVPAKHMAKRVRIGDLAHEADGDAPPKEPDEPVDHALASLNSSAAASYIRQSLETNFGIHAAAINAQSFSVKYCNARTGMLLVRAARDQLPKIWASLTFLTGLPSAPSGKGERSSFRYAWRVVHVSGTMRSSQKFAIKFAAAKIRRCLSRARTADGTPARTYTKADLTLA